MDIMEFSGKLEDLVDRAEASYIELIGALDLAKQRLILEALADEDEDDLDDDDELDDEEADEDTDEEEDEDEEDDDRFSS
jgi:hypothetical protein